MASNTMVFRLVGRDDLSRVFDEAGDNAERMHRRIRRASDDGSSSLDMFAVSAKDLGSAVEGAASAIGSGSRSGGMSGAMAGVAAVIAATALPSMSALVPMIAGAGVAALTAKLAFGGVGQAVELAGKDSKKYADALKKMSPEQRDFTKQVVSLKDEFKGLGREVQRIALPAFTSALKKAKPAVDILKGGVKQMAGVFADFGDEFGKLFASNRFQDALKKNLTMGAGFFRQMVRPLADLTQSVLDFGAKSKPALDAFGKGIGGLMSEGIPGFFDGLTKGVSGSAKMFDGLLSGIRKLLPALGDLIGAIADTLGPALGSLFDLIGTVGAPILKGLGLVLQPLKIVFRELGGLLDIVNVGFSAMADIAAQVSTVVLESLWPSFGKAHEAIGPLQMLAHWLKENKGAVMEFTRVAANGIIDFVSFVVSHLPDAVHAFKLFSITVLNGFDGMLAAAESSFGWIPGFGDKIKGARKSFDQFKSKFISGLGEAEAKSRDFANKAVPRLERNKLKMNIRNWESQIAEAKRKLKTVPKSKQAALKARISDLQDKVRKAKSAIAGVHGKTVTIHVNASMSAQAQRLAREGKLARGGLVHRFASGGAVQGFPGGGAVFGPGTATSDSIPAWLSNGEFVIRAAAVKRYGLRFFEQLNGMRAPHSPRYSGSMAARSHGQAGSPIVVHVNGAMDPVAVGKQIRKVLLELKRTYGMNVNLGVA